MVKLFINSIVQEEFRICEKASNFAGRQTVTGVVVSLDLIDT
jgi:hypothetical protein